MVGLCVFRNFDPSSINMAPIPVSLRLLRHWYLEGASHQIYIDSIRFVSFCRLPCVEIHMSEVKARVTGGLEPISCRRVCPSGGSKQGWWGATGENFLCISRETQWHRSWMLEEIFENGVEPFWGVLWLRKPMHGDFFHPNSWSTVYIIAKVTKKFCGKKL